MPVPDLCDLFSFELNLMTRAQIRFSSDMFPDNFVVAQAVYRREIVGDTAAPHILCCAAATVSELAGQLSFE